MEAFLAVEGLVGGARLREWFKDGAVNGGGWKDVLVMGVWMVVCGFDVNVH